MSFPEYCTVHYLVPRELHCPILCAQNNCTAQLLYRFTVWYLQRRILRSSIPCIPKTAMAYTVSCTINITLPSTLYAWNFNTQYPIAENTALPVHSCIQSITFYLKSCTAKYPSECKRYFNVQYHVPDILLCPVACTQNMYCSAKCLVHRTW